ncbi:somatostatin receptor type 2-like [Dendronephthya gigantea]|uniref:somatostatin receptor type 2-like n=1 Tax=Dendronephthya gigantea TaxID=151771 RepID=UPI001068E5E9|nr:somatostatin receptor type 2-like [Dendronephthya gigantea]
MMATTTENTKFSTTISSGTQSRNETEEVGSSLENYHGGLITLAILIFLCNLFAIQTYKRHEKVRRNCSNVMLLSLAISDMVVGVIYLPIAIFCESQWDKHYEDDTFLLICRVNFLVGNFVGFSTILHVIALTIEKYTAVLHPFQRLSAATRGTYRKILTVVWILSLVFAGIPIFWQFDNAGSLEWRQKYNIYGKVQATLFLGLASIILMYCYIRMFFQIHVKLSSSTQTGRVQAKARNDRKTVLIFLMFFLFFIAGWAPWFFFNLNTENQDLVSQEAKDFLVSLRYAGAVLNPLLYSFIKNDYKQAVQADFRKLCSSCPAATGFQKLVQTSTLQRGNNSHAHCTLSTGDGDVKLKKIESIQDTPENGSFTSGGPSGGNLPSLAEDTDL